MNKINITFNSGDILHATQLNVLVSKINELVDYINNLNNTPEDPNTVNPETTWPEQTNENQLLFTTITIPQQTYAERFANASSVKIVITKSTNNVSWQLHLYAVTNDFHNNYSIYLPSGETTTYYKIRFVNLDNGSYYEYPETITR